MKLNKQYILLIIILSISAGAFLLLPSFEREDFDTDIVEDISSGTISTTTTLNDESNSSIEEEIEVDTEVFETSIYDTLLINNETERIDEKFISYLIIGSDERSLASSASRGTASGSRADVIMMVLIDQNSNPSLISIPRDLLVKDPCTKNIQRINASYEKNECGSSEENLSAVLLNITGLKVNHFVKFNFEGFEEIIDSFGGVEVCVNETQREGFSFEIQKGCNILSGEIALNWVVSRNTEVLDGEKIVDENGNDISEWKPMSGVSDLTRVKKQQAIIISLMKGIREFESLNSFFKFVNALENAFIIDRNISVIQASELVWSFRNIDYDNINKLTVPTYNYTTEAGAQVLILDENFYEFLVSKGLIE
jgi:LCP family protein required for cell wall assembly